MTARSTQSSSVAAAKWPMVLAASIALVAVVAATPFIVYRLVNAVASARTATWVTLVAGLAMAVVLAIAWVLLRRRREAPVTGKID